VSQSNAIEVNHIAKHFGKKRVLQDVNFQIKHGQTFALLGRNGAGKTTLLRMLMGLLKPDHKSPSGQECSMSVLGMDPRKDAIEVRSRVGYLAEDQKMFGWMTIRQILDFMAPFYPNWDKQLAQRYRNQFELAEKTKVKHLSKGQSVRLGLLCALAHRPQLVILDDPALGLDPIMRKEFNRDLIIHLQSEGSTVFYSSHLLYEVEPIADEIAILDQGKIIIQKDTDSLRNDVKKLILNTNDFDSHKEHLSLLDVFQLDGQTNVTISDAEKAINYLRNHSVRFQTIELNLDEIFEAYVIGRTAIQAQQQQPTNALQGVMS
jgi:ABC-2 type transport system ATP-binding protein